MKAEALNEFRTADAKLQRRGETASTLREELEKKHADFVFEQQSATFLHAAVNRNEENPRYVLREGRKLHEEFVEFQANAKKVNDELENKNEFLHRPCKSESEQAA